MFRYHRPVTTDDRQPPRFRPAFAGVVLLFFTLGIVLPKLLFRSAWYRTHAPEWSIHLRYWIQPAIWGVCIALGWLVLERMRRGEAGLDRSEMGILVAPRRAAAGLGIAFLCTLPMLAVGLLSPRQDDLSRLFYGTVQAGFFEEWFFRAFAFGLLVQLGGMRVWPAAVLIGTVFGSVHLSAYTTDAISDEFAWVALIGLGGVLYAWLFWRWRWNLWLVIGLHTFMNLWWGVFDLDKNTLGGWAATASRVASIGLAITLTEFMANRQRSGTPSEPRTIG